jgi:hypothetical protein
MDRATQPSGPFVNLALTLFALFALFVGVLNVLEEAFALSGSSDYITVQSSGTCDRTPASELPLMNI